MPKEYDKEKRLQRDAKILMDYYGKGHNVDKLCETYQMHRNSFTPIINNEVAYKIRDTMFVKRVEMLPFAIEEEYRILQNPETKDEIKIKIIHKLMDDTGTGIPKTHTPESVRINIFNQKQTIYSTFVNSMIVAYGQEALRKASGQVIEAESTEVSRNEAPSK